MSWSERVDGWEFTKCYGWRAERRRQVSRSRQIAKLNHFLLMEAAHRESDRKKTSMPAQANRSLAVWTKGCEISSCESRESEKIVENSLKCAAAAQNKSINQKCRAKGKKRMILNESLFNVSKCIKRRFPARLLHTIQENNLFGLASHRFSVLLIIKPSYLYPNLTTQLCDVCLSVRRDKGKQHEKPTKTKQKLEMTRSTLTTRMIYHELWLRFSSASPLSQLKTHLLIDFDEIYFATGFARLS